MGIILSAGNGYEGSGVSSGLARGLIAHYDDLDITREGMGIGALAARQAGYTHFAREYQVNCRGKDNITKYFALSEQLSWSILGKPSFVITRIGEIINILYMKSTILQKILFGAGYIRKIKNLLQLQPVFITGLPFAEGCMEYQLLDKQVHIKGSITAARGNLQTIYVMNEFCGDFFNAGLKNNTVIRAPSGWEKLPYPGQELWLYNREKRIAFRVADFHSVPGFPVNIFWGREKAETISWAGFEYEFKLAGLKLKTIAFEYDVLIKEDCTL